MRRPHLADLAGQVGQMTRSSVKALQPAGSNVLPHWFQGAPLRQTLRVITSPAGAASTFHSICFLPFSLSPSGTRS
jgi:hypothetical protein